MESFVRKIVDPLYEKLNLLISICTIHNVIDLTMTQTAQVEIFSNEIRDDIERWQNYGVTSVPPRFSEAICLFISGERNRGYIVATEDKDSRPNYLLDGEVCIYTKEKDKIHFKKGNIIDLETNFLNINSKVKIFEETKEFELKASETIKNETISFELKSSNSTLIETESFEIKTQKFKVQGNSGELISILSELVQVISQFSTLVSSGVTPTPAAPSGSAPLSTAPKIVELALTLSQIKTKLDSFK